MTKTPDGSVGCCPPTWRRNSDESVFRTRAVSDAPQLRHVITGIAISLDAGRFSSRRNPAGDDGDDPRSGGDGADRVQSGTYRSGLPGSAYPFAVRTVDPANVGQRHRSYSTIFVERDGKWIGAGCQPPGPGDDEPRPNAEGNELPIKRV